MKKLLIFCAILLAYNSGFSQNLVTGSITGLDKRPLPGASVFIPEINKGTVSGPDGNFELPGLPNGKIKLYVSFVGYSSYFETIDLTGNPVTLRIVLQETVIDAEEIVITGGFNSTQHENAVKIEVLRLNPLTSPHSPNFMELIAKVPGVDMISKGSGISKPVIRGLSMNDILVLNNGVRFENYQYSSHHPLGIDEFGIRDVEIIKGPASLLYGSDAIGGVINFIKEKPAGIGTIAGDYNMQLFSNSLGMLNNVGIKGASEKFFGGVRVGQKSNADYLQGGGEFVPNSRFNEHSFKANAGYTDKNGTFKLFYDYNNQKLGLVEDEAIESISERGRANKIWYQELNTHLLSSQNKLYLGRFKLDLNSAFQNTELIHFGGADEVEIQMKLATLSYEVKLLLPSDKNSDYIIGFQGFTQRNTNLKDRETILLPDAVTNNYSAFGLLQHTFFDKLKFQTGIRYDIKSVSTEAVGSPSDNMNYRAPLDKSYGSFSGSLGAVYNVSEELLFRTNIAAAYRTPTLAELTSNGQHELRYEIGDQNLVPENAYEADISAHFHKENMTFDIAGFYNLINNYIFITPTGDTTSTGIDIFRYKQANSFLFGGEAGLHIHPMALDWLHFETVFSTVTGKQKNGDFLPFVPANNLRFELRLEKESVFFLKDAFVSVNTVTAFNQNNAAPDETVTKGYTLLDFGTGGNINVKNQIFSISIGINNLLDSKYTDHLSLLKEVNLFNPGRNISLKLKIPFSI